MRRLRKKKVRYSYAYLCMCPHALWLRDPCVRMASNFVQRSVRAHHPRTRLEVEVFSRVRIRIWMLLLL